MRYFFLFIILSVFTGVVYSQDFGAGVLGGIVASQLDGDTYSGYNKAGVIAGGYINHEFADKWLWQFGLQYDQKGSKLAANKSNIYYKAVLHYMEMPVTFRYRYYKNLDFEAGVSFGYLIKALEDKDGYGLIDAYPEFNSFELASLVGLNYTYNDKIIFGAHFSYSMLKVRAFFPDFSSFMDKGQYNNVLYFSLGYKLK